MHCGEITSGLLGSMWLGGGSDDTGDRVLFITKNTLGCASRKWLMMCIYEISE